MTHPMLIQIGNWNPQLLREIRGRLRWRSVLAMVMIVAIAYLLILLLIWQTGAENPWRNLFLVMMWLIAYGLYFMGGYSLVNDLTTEEQRGTLNFVRLSPRPSPTILLGKMLGVPLLYYLAIALFVPLHLFAGLLGRVPVGMILSFYVLLLAAGIFIFCLAMMYALVSADQSMVKTQPSTSSVSFAVITLLIFTPFFMGWNQSVLWGHFPELFFSDPVNLLWFYFPVGLNVWAGHGFTLVTLFVGTVLVWSVVKRRLEYPTATLMSKRQSYALVACLELLAVGFSVPGYLTTSTDFSEGALVVLYGLNLLLFVVLIFAISPMRQALLDWRYYESQQGSHWNSLIWGERSPAPLAIAINLGIAGLAVIPCFLWAVIKGESLVPLLGMALGLSAQVMFYAVLSQRILAAKVKNPMVWAGGTLAILMLVPVVTIGILSSTLGDLMVAVLFALWGFQGIMLSSTLVVQLDTAVLVTATLVTLVLQWCGVGVLTWHLQGFIGRMAASVRKEAIAPMSEFPSDRGVGGI